MTKNKRYFKREWEEEYYIFDSETISEKEFDEKVEYGYDVFADSMQGDEVVDKLNDLYENNIDMRFLLNNLREQSNEFHRAARENANSVWILERENEELKRRVQQLENHIMNKVEIISGDLRIV